MNETPFTRRLVPTSFRAAAVLALGWGCCTGVLAQTVGLPPVPPPAPLAPLAEDNRAGMISADLAAAAGREALQDGLPPSLAEGLFRQALASPDLPPATRDELNLALATAYLSLGEDASAEAALKAVADPASAPYLLRAALLAARGGQWAAADADLRRLTPAALPRADQPWFYFTQGLLADRVTPDHPADLAAAQTAWEQARATAVTTLQGEQFAAVLWREQLLGGVPVTRDQQIAVSKSADANKGTSVGVQFARENVLMLDELGQHGDALANVTALLRAAPGQSGEDQDEVRLLFGALARETDPPELRAGAQAALQKVLVDRGDHATMQLALAQLQRLSPTANDAADLQKFIAQLIADGHPLLDEIYLLQAQLLLAQAQQLPPEPSASRQQKLDEAAASAQKVLDQFPASPAYEPALRLLAYVAWNSQPPRYVTAESLVGKLRTVRTDEPELTDLTVILADLYFLNGDPAGFINAADLYEKLLANADSSETRGRLLLRLIESDVGALPADPTRLDAARQSLDDAVAHGGLAPLYRWRAEWNVLSALRNQGRDAEAFARLDHLLATAGDQAPPPELRLRLLWLDARLAVDLADPRQPADGARAAQAAAALQQAVDPWPADAQGLDQIEHDQLVSSALLLQGQAAYLNGQLDAYQKFFADLNNLYPASDAAAQAAFFAASALIQKNQIGQAQQAMTSLADKNPLSAYAPLARFYAAIYADELNHYDDELKILRDLAADLQQRDPRNPLRFQVLLREGDVMRKQYEFSNALDVYDEILNDNTWRDLPGRPRAALAEADCRVGLADKSPGDAVARQAARNALEGLFSQANLPVAAHLEAGYKLGHFLEPGDNVDAARNVYAVVVTPFLQDPARIAALDTQGGRYWLSRCVLALAGLYEKQNDLASARTMYEFILQHGLAGPDQAQSLLNTLPTAAAPAAVPAAPAPAAPPPAPDAPLQRPPPA